jgi:hypothetical protein
MKILIDNKEQDPLQFTNYTSVQTMDETLKAGDYTLVGHDMSTDDNSVIIERKKDCNELARNLGAYWERFCKEMEVLQQYKNRAIVVCSNNTFADLYNCGYTKLHPNFIAKRIGELQAKYQVPVLFLGNRNNVEDYIYRLFREIIVLTESQL